MQIGNRTSPWMTGDLTAFRDTVRRFIAGEFVPRQDEWRAQHAPDAGAWTAAAQVGLILPDVPESFGGGGGTIAYDVVVNEELAYAGVHLATHVQSGVAHYVLAYGTADQKERLLPRLASGELVAAIAMTEPGAGSDVQGIRTTARRDGADYVVNGSKTFITNGQLAGLVCLAARTDPAATGAKGISMLLVETRDLAGYRIGTPLEKVGMHGQDTCEIYFDDVRVPASSLLGGIEGKGMGQMMTQMGRERLLLSATAVAASERAVALTTAYARDRRAFGQPLIEFQNVRFTLATCATEARVGRVFFDECVQRALDGSLDPMTVAMAKSWTTEAQCRIIDACVQVHGGYGYMTEYPIARMWADSRVQRIYGGANELLKEAIAWSL
jgi:acyl-CoA dehydrogenase